MPIGVNGTFSCGDSVKNGIFAHMLAARDSKAVGFLVGILIHIISIH